MTLQMFPYGWELPDGGVVREGLYKGMALAAGAGYYRWVNPHAHHAYLHQCVHDWPRVVSGALMP